MKDCNIRKEGQISEHCYFCSSWKLCKAPIKARDKKYIERTSMTIININPKTGEQTAREANEAEKNNLLKKLEGK